MPSSVEFKPPATLLVIGTRVRSTRTERLVGQIAGYGVIQGPWSATPQPVYLVAVDVRLEINDPKYASISVIALGVEHVEVIK